MQAIRTVNLEKSYGEVRALRGLDLAVEEGEIYTLLGLNGAGKTTTMKILSCLTPPSAGDAFVFGKSVVSESEAVRSMIAISPQETALAQNLSVKENLMMMCGIYRMSKAQAEEKIGFLADRFSLREVLNRRAGRLSGGYRRRVSIAMALVGSPSLLFLDEPTLGLDVLARRELWETIRSLRGQSTVLLTTHYMEEAEALSDRVGIMVNGRLVSVGTPRELRERCGVGTLEQAFVMLAGEVQR